MPILFKSLAVQGICVGNREMLEAINQAIAQHQLQYHNHRLHKPTQTNYPSFLRLYHLQTTTCI
ncbi:MAG: hypothetical protein V7K27_13585 [Nostoc sp.]|uniref:hypothetical protein n=1 Tax=Nostoc sp. TaxID=1180 RepID=UPI002FF7ADF3